MLFISTTFGEENDYTENEFFYPCNHISCLPESKKIDVLRTIFDILDVNKDSTTDFEEIYNSQLKPLNIKDPNTIVNGKKYSDIFYSLINWIQKMDLNEDGKVTWKELVSNINEIFI